MSVQLAKLEVWVFLQVLRFQRGTTKSSSHTCQLYMKLIKYLNLYKAAPSRLSPQWGTPWTCLIKVGYIIYVTCYILLNSRLVSEDHYLGPNSESFKDIYVWYFLSQHCLLDVIDLFIHILLYIGVIYTICLRCTLFALFFYMVHVTP